MNTIKYLVYSGEGSDKLLAWFDEEVEAIAFAKENVGEQTRVEKAECDLAEDGFLNEIINSKTIWSYLDNNVNEFDQEFPEEEPDEFDTDFPESDINDFNGSDDEDFGDYAWEDDNKLMQGFSMREAVEALEENESEVECKCCFELFPKEDCIKTEKGYLCKKCNQELHSHQGTNLDLIDSDPFSLDYEDPRDPEEEEEPEVKEEPVDANEVRKFEAGIEEKLEEHINDRPADIESDQEYQGVDNAVVDCKKYTLVAHSEDEKPVDCKLEKPALEEPLAGDKVDAKLYEDAKLHPWIMQQGEDGEPEFIGWATSQNDMLDKMVKDHRSDFIYENTYIDELDKDTYEYMKKDGDLSEDEIKELDNYFGLAENLTEARKPKYLIQCSDEDGEVIDEFEVEGSDPIAEFEEYVNEHGQDFYDITLIDLKDYSIVKNYVDGVMNESLNENLDVNSYRIVLADYNDNNGDDQEDIEYLLKPGQTKGDLVINLSDWGFMNVYVHDGRPATEDEIKQADSLGIKMKPELKNEDPEDYGDADNFNEALEEAKKDEEELPPDPGAVKVEVHSTLNNLVADEIEAINGYEEAKADIQEQPIEHKDEIIATIDHIKDEEKEHIDELIDATTEIPFDKEEAPAPAVEEPVVEEEPLNQEFPEVEEKLEERVDLPAFDSDVKVGDSILIVNMEGEPDYCGRKGKVDHIDSIGQLHGSWGGLAVIPGVDEFEILAEESLKTGKVESHEDEVIDRLIAKLRNDYGLEGKALYDACLEAGMTKEEVEAFVISPEEFNESLKESADEFVPVNYHDDWETPDALGFFHVLIKKDLVDKWNEFEKTLPAKFKDWYDEVFDDEYEERPEICASGDGVDFILTKRFEPYIQQEFGKDNIKVDWDCAYGCNDFEESLTEASSAEKKAYNDGSNTQDLVLGRAIARIKDPKARAAAVAAMKAGRQDVVKQFAGDRKIDQSIKAFDQKQNSIDKAKSDADVTAESLEEALDPEKLETLAKEKGLKYEGEFDNDYDYISYFIEYKNGKYELSMSIYHASEDNNAENPDAHTEEIEEVFDTVKDLNDEYPDVVEDLYKELKLSECLHEDIDDAEIEAIIKSW